jgi:uncharacterized protein (DUF1330 family)
MYIEPTPAQLQTFVGDADGEPVFMLNLLRFKDTADGVLASEGISGADAYARYAAAVAPHLARVGGELVWAGGCDPALIGPSDAEWDLVALVRYPNRQAFVAMVSDADYLKTAALRSAALADSRLIPCRGLPAQ